MIAPRYADPLGRSGRMSTLAAEIQALLTTQQFGRALRTYTEVDSTNAQALAWAEAGAAQGSVVLAEYQHRGRGRLGRRWEAAPGLNLLFSIVLRPRLELSHLGLITLSASVAVVDALQQTDAALPVAVKWPNDIMLAGRKCCGMLLESSLGTGDATVVVLGIGLNVNQRIFPPALEPHATSMLLEMGRPVPRAPLMARMLASLERRLATMHQRPAGICSDYMRHMQSLGLTVHVKGPPPVTGTALGVATTGALRLRTPAGERLIHAGDLELAIAPA